MSDAIFTIYEYHIDKLPVTETNVYDEQQHLTPLKYTTKELFFESFLPEKGKYLDIWKEKKTENVVEKDEYKNKIDEHRDNIIILSVQANSLKQVHGDDWICHSVPNHPSFMVIFDNREGHQMLAIERKAMDTDQSAKILCESINHMMNPYGYFFRIFIKKRHLPFLEGVYDIKEKLNDKVNKVVFDFANNKEEKTRLKNSKFVHALNEWIGKFADSGQISANISDDEKLKSDTIRQDLELIAELCSTNSHYNLQVKFKNFGLFRFGQDVKAQYGVDEDAIAKFITPNENTPIQLEMYDDNDVEAKITLPQWFDKVYTIYKDYDKEALPLKKRKSTYRR